MRTVPSRRHAARLLAAALLAGLVAADAHAADGLSAVLEQRLPSLVGRSADGGAFVVDWQGSVPAAGELSGLAYDRRERLLSARLMEGRVSQPVVGRVRLMVDVPTPARPIAAGEVLRTADLSLLQVDLLAGHPEMVRDDAQIVLRAARRALEPGRPILARDLRSVPAITRNSIVTVTVRRGPILVRLKGKALEDAEIGRPIRVQNPDSRRVLNAIVVDRDNVEIGS